MTVAARRTQPAGTRDDLVELDEITLRRAQHGDRGACRALVERYQGAVFALVGRLLGRAGRAQVEDVAQDTFLAVWKGLPGFTPSGPARLSTWILTIAMRRAIDELRRPRLLPGPGADDVAGPHRGDDAARRSEVAAAVERAIGALAPEQRATFLLREYHGLDYAELARALDVDVGTIKSRLSRARAALRAALAEIHHDR
jgi:RNA polymerase sigma-70 factor (ECF subfamily)